MRHTTPILSVEYPCLTYPSIPQFERPEQVCRHVGEGLVGVSLDGTPLHSENFGFCSGLILRNTKNLESCLFHVSEYDLNMYQTGIIEYFMGRVVSPMRDSQAMLSVVASITGYETSSVMSRNEFTSRMEGGPVQARFVCGDDSKRVAGRIERNMLAPLGIEVLRPITVPTRFQSWDMVYYPKTSIVQVWSRKEKKVFEYRG